jgi:hypothetical protein
MELKIERRDVPCLFLGVFFIGIYLRSKGKKSGVGVRENVELHGT